MTHHSAPNSSAQWRAIDKWYAERFAHQLKLLDDLGILSTTAVVWGSEISERHDQTNMHWVLGGGADLGLKTGKLLRFDSASLADLYVTIQKKLGVASETFGDPKFCTGGLPGLG